jgi:hypothetical protein
MNLGKHMREVGSPMLEVDGPSGAKSFVHIPDTQRHKLDPKSLRCFLIRYCDLQKGYRFWDPKSPII